MSSEKIYFSSEYSFVLANSAVPDEMSHYAEQCKQWSDSAFWSVWSDSALFADVPVLYGEQKNNNLRACIVLPALLKSSCSKSFMFAQKQ